ncbi:MAG: hypothetical protein M3Q88_03270 [Pseudomonadota bacterium]|nr:hypothetical protein [Pseudomonadota bacterium]
MSYRLIACGLLLAPAASFAQVNTTTALAPVPLSVSSTSTPTLRTGTRVQLRLLEELTTGGKQLRVGQIFRMETAAPLLVNGVTVVPAGTPAVGEITEARNKGMWGKSGRLAARMVSMTVNGRQIRLSGTFDDKGSSGGVGAVAVSALVFLPAGFFMTGKSAKMPIGTSLTGFVDEDVPLSLAAVAAPALFAVGVANSAPPQRP